MIRFLKIRPDTLYAHLSQEELHALGIDIQSEDGQTKERLMEVITKSLHEQEEMDVERPLNINITVTNEGMQILVTECHPQDVPPEVWEHIAQDLFDETDDDEAIDIDHVFYFADFEEVLQLVKDFPLDIAEIMLSNLYVYENKYYLTLHLFQAETVDEIEDILSLVTEFGMTSKLTTHMLEEYGQLILEDVAIEELYDRFLQS